MHRLALLACLTFPCLSASAQDGALLPGGPGTTWVYRRSAGEAVEETTWTLVRRAGLERIALVDRAEGMPERFPTFAGEDALVLSDGADRHREWIVVRRDGELRLYRNWAAFGSDIPAPLELVVREDVADGDRWRSPRVVLSCGFMDLPFDASARAERIEVPAGTFDAIRIDADGRTLWFARGVGLVRIDGPDGAREELVRASGRG